MTPSSPADGDLRRHRGSPRRCRPLLLKAYVERQLIGAVALGPLLIHVEASPGVAFGLGDTVSGSAVDGAVAAIVTTTLAVHTWRTTDTRRETSVPLIAGAVIAGATANLIDLAGDGTVTEYLHSGCCPPSTSPTATSWSAWCLWPS